MSASARHGNQWEKRHKERELAFQILYALSYANEPGLSDVKNAYMRHPDKPAAETAQDEPAGFAWNLISGVWDNEKFLDDDIQRLSHNWRIDRMGRIELILMRLALYELGRMGTPAKVIISEYLSLAGQFGIDSAKSFINGILDSAAKKPARPE